MTESVGSPGPGQETPPVVDYGALIADSADVNTVATVNGVYHYVSAACLELFGWDPAELEGRQQDDFVHPDDLPLITAQRRDAVALKTRTLTYRFLCRNGSYRWVEARSRPIDAGQTVLVVSAMRDMAERQKTDVLLQRQAFSDPLTGVANRTVLMDRLRQALRRQDRAKGVLAVLYVDLDRRPRTRLLRVWRAYRRGGRGV